MCPAANFAGKRILRDFTAGGTILYMRHISVILRKRSFDGTELILPYPEFLYTLTNLPRANGKYTKEDFNYPSFSVPFETGLGIEGSIVKYKRTLTNVGAPATYTISLYSQTRAMKMSVELAILSFSTQYEKKSYTVTFRASSMPSGSTGFASLEWSDGKHIIGSPIAFS
ncbi:hypothetical protein GOBAR_DD15833 [Gossypium barbadense]|nr:hypothetical protein GOBAR_DD15833 [Gossypium barbadense]